MAQIERHRECGTCAFFKPTENRHGQGICAKSKRDGTTYAQYVCPLHQYNFDEARDYITVPLSVAYTNTMRATKEKRAYAKHHVRHLK